MGNVEEGEDRCGEMGIYQEDGPRRWTKGGTEEEPESKESQGLGARDMGEEYRCANVQRRYFNQFGGAQQERSIITHVP